MNKCKKNFRNAQIKAENDAELMPSVDPSNYSELFQKNYEVIVLFDFKTDVHPKMHNVMLPGLSTTKREFKKAYAEILLRQLGDRILFAMVDYNDSFKKENGNNIVSLFQHQNIFKTGELACNNSNKLGEIRFISPHKGVVGIININDMTESLNKMFDGFLMKDSNSPFDQKVKHVCGVDKNGIISTLKSCGFNIPDRKRIDFSMMC